MDIIFTLIQYIGQAILVVVNWIVNWFDDEDTKKNHPELLDDPRYSHLKEK